MQRVEKRWYHITKYMYSFSWQRAPRCTATRRRRRMTSYYQLVLGGAAADCRTCDMDRKWRRRWEQVVPRRCRLSPRQVRRQSGTCACVPECVLDRRSRAAGHHCPVRRHNNLTIAPAISRSAKRVLAIVILSVRLSVTPRYQFKPRWDKDSGFLPYDSVETIVYCEQISCRWVRRLPSNEGIKDGYAPKKALFYRY